MATGGKVDVFEHIFRTELDHRGSWKNATRTILIYTVNKSSWTKIQNVYLKHAEETLIKQLEKEYLMKIEKIRINVDVYINNSPCAECADRLHAFLENYPEVQMYIYFANLYNIRRNSCIKNMTTKDEEHVWRVSNFKSIKNSMGLVMLLDHNRCTLQPFNKQTWVNLLDLLKDNRIDFNQMYQEICGDRSREEEDAYLREDLEIIKKEGIAMKIGMYMMVYALLFQTFL
ncbi:C-_U-editing enzyme APOBEC-1-like [Saccostrea cucullata]|uniref:C->U-editing enzyme APOBEC-1-like n=1 Tax=Saccostrea cuccullata TaxID=36930 RepID=UPI002ED62E7F